MPVPHRERSSVLPVLIVFCVIAMLGWIGLAQVNRARGPECDGLGRVLVSWPPQPSTTTTVHSLLSADDPGKRTSTTLPRVLTADDLRERTFTIGEPGQKVRIDVDLGRPMSWFSLTHVYSVRVGTPADLVDEAVHPDDPPAVITTGGTSGRGPQATTGSAPPSLRPAHWQPRAIVSGDVMLMGSGNEDINEELTLPAGTWYLATDDDTPSMPITLRVCGAG